jgi:ribosomal protein S18 acetylase RimI-like enzyme
MNDILIPETGSSDLGRHPGSALLSRSLGKETGGLMAAVEGYSIRPYEHGDEPGWVRCRVLSFLDSAYFDDVAREKTRYTNPAIELVAESAAVGSARGLIAGFIDVECEKTAGSVCSARPGLAGMIWNLGVHPDHRGRGLASGLLRHAIGLAIEKGIERLEVWTRDDPGVLAWYESKGFKLINTYLHVYLGYDEAGQVLDSDMPGLRPVKVFCHFSKDPARFEEIRQRFERVHDCNLLELDLSASAGAGGEGCL